MSEGLRDMRVEVLKGRKRRVRKLGIWDAIGQMRRSDMERMSWVGVSFSLGTLGCCVGSVFGLDGMVCEVVYMVDVKEGFVWRESKIAPRASLI